MAVFYDTGGGDIYAGETKQDCVAAMKSDIGDEEVNDWLNQGEVQEVSGEMKMRLENEDGTPGELVTLDSEYTNLGYGYCIASSNH